MVFATIDFPQLLFDTVADALCCSSCRVPLWRRGISPRSRLRRTIEISQLLVKVIDAPVMLVVRVPQVPSWRRQLCSHSSTC